MGPIQSFFKLCPRCGSPGIRFLEGKEFLCGECGFDYFHNVATAAGAFLLCGGKLLFIVRAKDPAKGKLCLPGGFVNPREGIEEAITRECLEELGIHPSSLKYLASFPNSYEYKGVGYSTCDIFFEGDLGDFPLGSLKLDPSEASGVELLEPADIRGEKLAFPSLRLAFAAFLKKHGSSGGRQG